MLLRKSYASILVHQRCIRGVHIVVSSYYEITQSNDYTRLILRSDGRDIREMSDDSRMLGFYSIESGMEIHIIDTDPFRSV